MTGYSYFGARNYSPELSVWLGAESPERGSRFGMDPLSDKYPSLSPYNYCALNPIMLVDPDGREIVEPSTEEGKALWSEFKSLVNSRVNAYDARTAELRERGKNWRADKRERNRDSNPFVQVQNEINDLEKSTNVYQINIADLGAGKGGNLSSSDGNTINVNVNSSKHGDYSLIQRLAHELKHAHQFEIGDLDLHKGGFGGELYDKTDELGAYNRGNLFYGLGSYGRGSLLPNVWESFFSSSSRYYNLSPENKNILNTGLSGEIYSSWVRNVQNSGGMYFVSNRAKKSIQ